LPAVYTAAFPLLLDGQRT